MTYVVYKTSAATDIVLHSGITLGHVIRNINITRDIIVIYSMYSTDVPRSIGVGAIYIGRSRTFWKVCTRV